jgi:hypothetical protein
MLAIHRLALLVAVLIFSIINIVSAENFRPFKDDADAEFWLENMLSYHHFTLDEIHAATGLSTNEIPETIKRLNTKFSTTIPNDRYLVLPYPGGRHPRIGFLEGAVDPQRETKVSVFLPWDKTSYVVVDVPEAIWSNLGLTYLAHTHVPTIWAKQKIDLPPLEWKRMPGPTYSHERELPNGIRFGAEVIPTAQGVRMREWLRNDTKEKLTDLRVQNCVMLKAAAGFNSQTNANKIFAAPYCAVKSDDGRHWIITAWTPIQRPWANAPVPCLHADPKFPDCDPGRTVEVRGWLSFYEGDDVQTEFRRLDSVNWK